MSASSAVSRVRQPWYAVPTAPSVTVYRWSFAVVLLRRQWRQAVTTGWWLFIWSAPDDRPTPRRRGVVTRHRQPRWPAGLVVRLRRAGPRTCPKGRRLVRVGSVGAVLGRGAGR